MMSYKAGKINKRVEIIKYILGLSEEDKADVLWPGGHKTRGQSQDEEGNGRPCLQGADLRIKSLPSGVWWWYDTPNYTADRALCQKATGADQLSQLGLYVKCSEQHLLKIMIYGKKMDITDINYMYFGWYPHASKDTQRPPTRTSSSASLTKLVVPKPKHWHVDKILVVHKGVAQTAQKQASSHS